MVTRTRLNLTFILTVLLLLYNECERLTDWRRTARYFNNAAPYYRPLS